MMLYLIGIHTHTHTHCIGGSSIWGDHYNRYRIRGKLQYYGISYWLAGYKLYMFACYLVTSNELHRSTTQSWSKFLIKNPISCTIGIFRWMTAQGKQKTMFISRESVSRRTYTTDGNPWVTFKLTWRKSYQNSSYI